MNEQTDRSPRIITQAEDWLARLDSRNFSERDARHAVPTELKRPRLRYPHRTALLLGTLVLALAGAWFWRTIVPQTFANDTVQTRTIDLAGGTRVQLNAKSEVRWIPRERTVQLIAGEALFEIGADASRPFRVRVGRSDITAIGTRFDIYRKPADQVVVTVVEGRVSVRSRQLLDDATEWHRELGAGEQLIFAPIGIVADVRSTDAQRATLWQEGRLQVVDERLEQIVAELRRYSERPILILDPRVADLRIGGTLSVRNPAKALHGLERLGPFAVTETPQAITLTYLAREQADSRSAR